MRNVGFEVWRGVEFWVGDGGRGCGCFGLFFLILCRYYKVYEVYVKGILLVFREWELKED